MVRFAVLAVLAASAAGCLDARPSFEVTELEVTGELDFGSLDVEVHLFDQDSRRHLGCAGADEGLEEVDASDVRYSLRAELRVPGTEDELHDGDLAGRRLELIVIEDDDLPCPVPPGPDDDVIGIAQDLRLETFERGQVLAFDDVVALGIDMR